MYATEGTASSALLCLVFGGGDSSAREKAKTLSIMSVRAYYGNNDANLRKISEFLSMRGLNSVKNC